MKTNITPTPTLRLLSDKIDRLEALTLIGAKSVLNLQEAVLYTGYSKGHLYRLTSTRQIPHFKKYRRLFFLKSELDWWMTENSVPTQAETAAAAATYCSTHHKS